MAENRYVTTSTSQNVALSSPTILLLQNDGEVPVSYAINLANTSSSSPTLPVNGNTIAISGVTMTQVSFSSPAYGTGADDRKGAVKVTTL